MDRLERPPGDSPGNKAEHATLHRRPVVSDHQPAGSEEFARILAWAWTAAKRHRVSDIEADEVAQVTATKIWERWDSPAVVRARSRDLKRWRGYIQAVARNTHRDLVRSHQRRLARNERALDLPTTPRPDRPGVQRSSVAETAVVHAGRLVLVEALATLPWRQRQIAYFIIEQRQTPTEVGELLGIEPQTVRKHLRAAQAALREHLAQSERV